MQDEKPKSESGMSLDMKRVVIIILATCFLAALLIVAWIEARKKVPKTRPKPVVNARSKKCVDCHKQKTPGVVKHWEMSVHALKGVGCFDCHEAKKGDKDRRHHEGYLVSSVVSSKDCGRCHEKEWKQFRNSHHAKAAQFIGSLDNILGEVVEGRPAAALGCKQCHGSRVKVLAEGKLDPQTWPNTGIGRVNPDGSFGSCSACHQRHTFSKMVARRPENCGRCHMGPDHPQKEVYEESKHGIAFAAFEKEMALSHPKWIVGKHYSAAPTCATCHASRTATQKVTHDVGERISWTLRPVVSGKLKNWKERRKRMQNVCGNCHGVEWVENFYKQYDEVVIHYNEKFAKPAKGIMKWLRANGKITESPFDDKIEWIFFELWHHEGRRARMGAAMMGPDYTQWHGFYEVAKHFYFKFIPEAEKLGGEAIKPLIEKLYSTPYHRWRKGMSLKQREKLLKWYKSRYGAKGATH